MASTNSRPWLNAGIVVISFSAIAVFVALDFLLNTQVPMQEVGATPESSHLVGQTFRTRDDLRVFGITADRHYAPQIDYYVLVGRPGFDGPEIITRQRLPKGTVIKVVGVRESKAPLLILTDGRPRRTRYVVQATAGAELVGPPMRLDPKGDVSDPNFGVDDSLFDLIHE